MWATPATTNQPIQAVVHFEVARASCPCEVMAKMAMPLQIEPLPPFHVSLTREGVDGKMKSCCGRDPESCIPPTA
jgi:hypothetical protein